MSSVFGSRAAAALGLGVLAGFANPWPCRSERQ